MDDWSEKYSATAQCEKGKGKRMLSKIRKGLLDDAKYVHEALVEKLPRPIDVLDMVSETERH